MSDTGADKDGEPQSFQGEIARGELIEGGHVGPLEEVPFEVRHRAQTARWLAISLIATLGLSFFAHYGVTAYFIAEGKADAVEGLSRAFNVWLPVISSLAGGAAAYYFTREKER
jgi:hypothetical protein